MAQARFMNDNQIINVYGDNQQTEISVVSQGNYSTGTYIHDQGESSNVWIINHNLNKYPSVTVVDSANNIISCVTRYIDNNSIKLYFNGEFKGKAYLN